MGAEDAARYVDPYFAWLAATDFAGLAAAKRSGARFPVLVELQGTTAAEFARAAGALARAAPESLHVDATVDVRAKIVDALRVPALYLEAPRGLEATTFCSASVSADFFESGIFALANQALGKAIAHAELSLPLVTAAETGFAPFRPAAFSGAKAPPVVVGVVDDRIPFAHERFREAGAATTRIDWFWEQPDPYPRGGASLVAPPGREFDKAGIDALLAQARHAGNVDEDELYARADFPRPAWHRLRRRSHGAHVADLACGADPAAAAGAPRIVAVQLPPSVVRDTSGYHLTAPLLDAVHYIVHRADRIADAAGASRPPPVVVSLSWGDNRGPHDGSGYLARAIDQIVAARRQHAPMSVVIAAGNAHLSRCHASLAVAQGAQRTLAWRIPPDNATASILELWTDDTGPLPEIEVVPPAGTASGWVEPGGVWPGATLWIDYRPTPYLTSGSRRGCVVIVAPTADSEGSAALATCGTWRVNLRLPAGAGGAARVEAWIQRNDNVIGYARRSRQSRFEDATYERFDSGGRPVEADNASVVRRAGMTNGVATGAEPVVIGGYRVADGAIAPYSAGGQVADATALAIRGPDALAPSDDDAAARGVLAAGSRSGACVAMNGTSVAAPQVARWIAGEMARNPGFQGTRADVASRAQGEEAAQAGRTRPLPPRERRGGGRLRLPKTNRLR